MKILQLVCIILLALSISANAMIRNVPSQYTTIQGAVNSSSNGDTVLVQPGTYFENVIYRGKNIVLTSRYYQNNDYSFIKSTIINGSTPAQPDSASCVMFINHEDSTAVLQGFTITGGAGTKWTDEHGAGLYREGGGVLVAYSFPVIQNNIITGNNCILGGVTSTGGGGMRIGDCYCKVFNNIITNNSARYGAGIVLNYSGGEYKNNVICKNFGSVDYGAGASMWINDNYIRPRTIVNNTIVFNSSLTGTPGIIGFGPANLKNNIIWGNSSPSNTQISGSGFSVTYCNVQNGYNGAGNINSDPLFDSVNYYIKNNSPCVDRGDSSLIYNDISDPGNPANAKWPSKGLLRNDMGAYGGPGSKVIANNVVAIHSNSELLSPDKFYLDQNYPNPFNPKTIINYQCSMFNFVSLKVYDVLGHEVAVLVNEKQGPGSYEVEFDGSSFASGIYFYQLNSGDFVSTKKMNLVK